MNEAASSDALVGALAAVLGGLANGSFAVPFRRIRAWKWEQSWLVYVTVGYLVLPLGIALCAAPWIPPVLRSHFAVTARVVLLGCAWGIGVVCYGLSLNRLGVSVTNAIVCGISVLLGSLVPAMDRSVGLDANAWMLLGFGLLLTVSGIMLCSLATLRRDRDAAAAEAHPVSSTAGLVFALLSGVFGAFLNIAFASAAPLVEQGRSWTTGGLERSLAAWVPTLFGAFLVNAVYSVPRIVRSRSWGLYARGGAAPWGLSLLMALIWFAGVATYGVGALLMGSAGAVYGWALLTGASILVSALWGVVLHEWSQASTRARQYLLGGVAFLLASLVVLSVSAARR